MPLLLQLHHQVMRVWQHNGLLPVRPARMQGNLLDHKHLIFVATMSYMVTLELLR